MKTIFISLCCAAATFFSAGVKAATYNVTSTGNYTTTSNFTAPCAVGTCANYTSAMNVSGTFDVPTLAPNLTNSNIATTVTAFSFNDGVNTYASTDPNVRKYQFVVTTNASGVLTSARVLVEKWLTGARPHTAADYFSFVLINGASVNLVVNNTKCSIIGIGGDGDVDACISNGGGTQQGTAEGATVAYSVGAPPAAASIPTLNEYALLLLASLVAGFGTWQLRKRTPI